MIGVMSSVYKVLSFCTLTISRVKLVILFSFFNEKNTLFRQKEVYWCYHWSNLGWLNSLPFLRILCNLKIQMIGVSEWRYLFISFIFFFAYFLIECTLTFHFLLFLYQTLKCLGQFVQNFPSLAESQFMGKFVFFHCLPLTISTLLLFTKLKMIVCFFHRFWFHYAKHLCHLLLYMNNLQLKDLKIHTKEDMIPMVQKQALNPYQSSIIFICV